MTIPTSLPRRSRRRAHSEKGFRASVDILAVERVLHKLDTETESLSTATHIPTSTASTERIRRIVRRRDAVAAYAGAAFGVSATEIAYFVFEHASSRSGLSNLLRFEVENPINRTLYSFDADETQVVLSGGAGLLAALGSVRLIHSRNRDRAWGALDHRIDNQVNWFLGSQGLPPIHSDWASVELDDVHEVYREALNWLKESIDVLSAELGESIESETGKEIAGDTALFVAFQPRRARSEGMSLKM